VRLRYANRTYGAKSKSKKIEIFATMNSPVGHKLVRGATNATNSSNVLLILKRDPKAPLGYFILTGMLK
jgi:lysophospholipid acyltransferase (LPLAT)-like uncharacterized protein